MLSDIQAQTNSYLNSFLTELRLEYLALFGTFDDFNKTV